MKSPHGHAIGRIIREARLRTTLSGKVFVEATIEMDEPRKFQRGEYAQRVDICTEREDQLAIVTRLKEGVMVRVEGEIDSTAHKDRYQEAIYTRVRITGSIEVIEEAGA